MRKQKNVQTHSINSPIPPEAQSGNIETNLIERAKKANDAGYLVAALLHLCKASAEFADDQEGYPSAQHIPASMARVLRHVEDLVGEMHCVVERVAMSGEVTA